MLDINAELLDLFACVWAGFCSFIVGFERQRREKAAGIRTHLLVSLGSCAFTLLSANMGTDPSRIAAQIVSGIGFLGGGVIMRDSNKVMGLTTASTVWVSAAIGMLCGGQRFLLAFSVSLLTILFLYIGRQVSRLLKAIQYNWLIDIDIHSECDLNKLRMGLLEELEQKKYKIINYTTNSSGEIKLLINMKGSASNLSRIIKEVIPANIKYHLDIGSQERSMLFLDEDLQ